MEARYKTLRILAGLVVYLSIAQNLPAQLYYSSLVGTVRDTSGAVVPHAQVIATDVSTGVKTSTATDDAGNFLIETLRPGTYTLSTVLAGFRENVVTDIELLVGKTTRVDVTLEVGEVTQTVKVNAEAPLMQTETSDRGAVLETREVQALPLIDRNFAALITLSTGALASNDIYSGEPVAQVNGMGAQSNQFYVDGGNLTSAYLGMPVERINIDTIQEFKVETSNYSAQVGLRAGSTIAIATKHGTNDFHGSAYEFWRNDILNARNFFADSIPKLRYNLFGGTLGGPVVKNKLFFFGDYEGVREYRGQTFFVTVPTPAERAGNFTPGTGAKDTAQIFNPFDVDPATGLRRPFPGNQIPPSMFNPVAVNYLDLWPLPNTPGIPNYRTNINSKNNYNRFAVRIDYEISEHDRIYGRYGYQSNPVFRPTGPGPGNSSTGNFNNGRDLVVTWTHLFGANSLNEVRFSYAKFLQLLDQSDFAGVNEGKELGFDNGDRIPQLLYGCPVVYFTSVPTLDPCLGGPHQYYPSRTYHITDDYTLTRGPHTFKAGFLNQRYLQDGTYAYAGGAFNFISPYYTSQIGDYSGGQDFASFLLGAVGPRTFVDQTGEVNLDRRNLYQFYFQDDWSASSKLTLQLGIRWDVNRPSYFADGKGSAWMDNLDKRTGQVLNFPKNANGPLQQALGGQSFGYPYHFLNQNGITLPNWRNIGPRVGVAFRPFGDTKTVIRGGFGIYYDIYNGTNNTNGQRPFFVVGFTPSRPDFEPPPFILGKLPVLSPRFAPGEPLYVGYNAWPEWPDARSDQWNVTVQRELGRDTALEVGYVGNRHLHGVSAYGWNHIYMPGYTFNYDDGSSFTIQSDTPLAERVKYPQLASRATTRAIDHGRYDALQVYLTRRLSHGIQGRVGYTRARSYGFELEGYGPLNVEVPDEWNTNINFPLQNDVKNIFFATWVWQLPGFNLHGLPGAVIGGWQTAGILSHRSGLPVDVNEAICQWDGASICKPTLLRDPNLPSSERTLQKWFDTSAFQTPGLNDFGSNAAIDSVRGPGLTNLDLTLSKYFKIHERHRIQFRAEFFNALNHPAFGLPATTNDASGFGQITSSGRGREIQFALKYEF